MRLFKLLFIVLISGLPYCAASRASLHFSQVQWTTNKDLSLRVVEVASPFLTLERSADLVNWEPLATLKTVVTNAFEDNGAVYQSQVYYRAREVDVTNTLTGDHLATSSGVMTIRPVDHASFVVSWNGLMIYNDPVGAASLYAGIPKADLILISHEHGDHFSATTVNGLLKTNPTRSVIIAPRTVYNGLSTATKTFATILTNGAATNVFGIDVSAVPAYNQNHTKGNGNGYVIDLGGKRLYMSGDTGPAEEIKQLQDIDVAFLSMNLPFTMSITQAADVTRAFKPRIIYPYHFRNQDGSFADRNAFRRQVGPEGGVEVRIRKWY